MAKICCVYKITNLVNNMIYIGQTIDYVNRINHHKNKLKRNSSDCKLLQIDYNKYGLSNFKFEILEKCDKEKLLEQETYWINYYGGVNSDKIYNMVSLDYCSEEFKYKMRMNRIGKKLSEEAKHKISVKNKGRFKGSKNFFYGKSKKGNLNPNYGYRKYSKDFIEKLRNEFNSGISKKQLGLKYNISYGTICNLINHGCSQNPKTYK